MIKLTDKGQCSGCHGCCQVCPKNCIEMKEDENGFFYPAIEEKLCINCHLCEKACPILNAGKKDVSEPDAYACLCRDEKIRRESSSGGMFTLFAEWILEQGGIVFGAAFDEQWNVCHRAVDTKEELWRLRGAKYLQSRIGDSYSRAGMYLENGRMVYFTGTPCQIDGLKSFLRKDYGNLLFCQDIVCHGVPSPKLWQRYLRGLAEGGGWKKISFREKTAGWKNYHVKFSGEETDCEEQFDQNIYMKLFLQNISLRPSCYTCHSKGVSRSSDLTLGDFWGAEKAVPDMDDDGGISLVLVQTDKGRMLLDAVAERMVFRQVKLTEAVAANPSVQHAAKCSSKKRRQLFDALAADKLTDREFVRVAERLTSKNPAERFKEFVWKLTVGRKV